MDNATILLAVVFVPTAGAFLLPMIGRYSERIRNYAALAFVAFAFIGCAAIARPIIGGDSIIVDYGLPLGFNFVVRADCLALFMAMVSSFIGAIIVLFSFDYISHYDNRNEYYLMVVLFLGAMMGLVFSANLILLFVFWEITAITSWRLIGFFREKEHVFRADKAFLVTVFGALAMLLGFILIREEAGSFDLAVIKEYFMITPAPNIAVFLILLGILSKSAVLPFHTWLPDAGVAPSPVTALLHAAVLVKIGVYVFARLFIATFSYDPAWGTIIIWVAASSALVSAGAALVDTDIKRVIAYSTVSQIGFIILGFAAGNAVGIAGALLFILMHGLAKGGLFLCAGIIEQNTGTKDITRMGGLISTMPVTAVSFLACAFSIMGIPPFGGFFSKYMVFSGTVADGQNMIALVFLAGSIMTILYLFRLFNSIFLGSANAPAREGSRVMVASVAILAALSLAFGFYIAYPSGFVQAAVKQMLGT